MENEGEKDMRKKEKNRTGFTQILTPAAQRYRLKKREAKEILETLVKLKILPE